MTTEVTTKRRYLLPYRFVMEPRLEEVPRWMPPLVSLGAIAVALIVGGVILAAVGGDPFRTYAHIATASFGSLGVFSDTLVKAAPLILVGLACTLAFRMRLWNIGAEGQFYAGAFGASAVVLAPLLPPETPGYVTIPAMMLAGFVTGALWGFVPGYLKAKLNVNEIITTLMMNYIAISWNNFFIFGVWSEGGFQMSKVFSRTAWLPRLADYARQVPLFRGLVRWRSHGEEYGAGDDALRWLGRAGRHVGDLGRGAPAPGGHLAGLWLYRHHRCLAGQA
jgi:simple sugar transport system permease protein